MYIFVFWTKRVCWSRHFGHFPLFSKEKNNSLLEFSFTALYRGNIGYRLWAFYYLFHRKDEQPLTRSRQINQRQHNLQWLLWTNTSSELNQRTDLRKKNTTFLIMDSSVYVETRDTENISCHMPSHCSITAKSLEITYSLYAPHVFLCSLFTVTYILFCTTILLIYT